MPVLADPIDRIDDGTRQQLYRLAAVRGYRLFTDRASGHTRHFVATIGREGRRERPQRLSPSYQTKKEARRELLRLIIEETRRFAA